MPFLRSILRIYSFLFEFALCAASLILALAALTMRADLHINWLPWTPAVQPKWLLGLALAGFVCLAFALFGRLRILLFLFAGFICFTLARGLFAGPFTFSGRQQFWYAAAFFFASLLAFLGALPSSRRTRIR